MLDQQTRTEDRRQAAIGQLKKRSDFWSQLAAYVVVKGNDCHHMAMERLPRHS
jgi:hypothetical protein